MSALPVPATPPLPGRQPINSDALVSQLATGASTSLMSQRAVRRVAYISATAIAIELGQVAIRELTSLALRRAVERMLARRAEKRQQGQDPNLAASKTWVTRHDSRVRDQHAALHGLTVPIGEPFITPDGSGLMYPGDGRAPAHQRINCRCTLIEGDD